MSAKPAEQDLGQVTSSRRRLLAKLGARLEHGFSTEAAPELRRLVGDAGETPATRLAAGGLLLDWQRRRRAARAEDRHLDFDIVIVSHFALPGGNTTAVAEEVTAYRRAGLRVGLLHHPVFHWDVSRPLNPKIADQVDGDLVRLIGAWDSVRCALLVVRLPTVVLRRRDDMPAIEADRTVLVVNQTPFKYYGEDGGAEEAWDVARVRASMDEWVGECTWYPVGPMVREVLGTHHAAELDGVRLAADDWHECLDPALWGGGDREDAPSGGPIRIGRHTRDHALKWPQTREALEAAYPVSADFDVRILGGADTVAERLGPLPENWTVLPFGSTTARSFLRDLDVFVYFIAAEGREAFGLAPLEAMASGVPAVMDPRFAPLFGDAAVYCEPEEVAATVRALVADPEAYAAQRERGLKAVEERFSHAALLRRVAGLGVAAAR
ncbi:Glycosyltransferase involved in cell wall bisynthesis [Glycomyces sambucus]|uniref:Glycosyltransferase involved in cell wall bisynthesis n=1 Tax=Glycomyces sambucus TaxID=380244 RepID=A0A1G9GYG3_9ACTN|nr:glycosyltransferase [Glycomyces sambucus]SDL05711.1 Glycosyltransferase involved in cell wall bisynthesis [Glycomyces sambucus]